jgi:ubiquinone/menaquinone biosynthesis C-methylase UbiE
MRDWALLMSTEIFEELADEYDRWFEERADLYRQELALVRRSLPAVRGRALEVGCGTGRFASPLSIGVCVEPAAAMARIAKERGVEVVRARAEALPVNDAAFDLVLMITVICYLKDPRAAFAEALRVLRPEGIFVNAFLERGGNVAARCIRSPGKSRFLSIARFFSAGEVTAMLKEEGFGVLEIRTLPFGFTIITASAP